MLAGTFPEHDPWGGVPENRWRREVAGKPLTDGGWRGAYSGFRADLVYMQQVFRFNYHRVNFCCKDCFAHKRMKELSMTDFRQCAGWRRTLVSHEDYMANATFKSKLCDIPGWSLQNCHHDTMHGQNLGTGQRLAGSCMFALHRLGHFGDAKRALKENLNTARIWQSVHPHECIGPLVLYNRCTGTFRTGLSPHVPPPLPHGTGARAPHSIMLHFRLASEAHPPVVSGV